MAVVPAEGSCPLHCLQSGPLPVPPAPHCHSLLSQHAATVAPLLPPPPLLQTCRGRARLSGPGLHPGLRGQGRVRHYLHCGSTHPRRLVPPRRQPDGLQRQQVQESRRRIVLPLPEEEGAEMSPKQGLQEEEGPAVLPTWKQSAHWMV